MAALPAMALVALALAGCGGAARGGGDDIAGPDLDPAEETSEPAGENASKLCTAVTASIIGRVTAGAAKELSGLVMSRSQAQVMWTHNDSGDSARMFAVARDGRLRAEVTVTGADAVDWEDIAAGPGVLLLGDIGDNDRARESIAVYRVAEPRLARSGSPVKRTVAATRIELHYPDGAHDAEALLRDPGSGALVIIEKNGMGHAGVFVAAPTPGGPRVMRRTGTLRLGVRQVVTGGDISADGRTIVLRTYDKAFVWRRAKGDSVAKTLNRPYCRARANLRLEGQGEALALTRDASAFYTVPEGERPQIWRYVPEG